MAKTDVSTVVYSYGVHTLPDEFRKSGECRRYSRSYPMISTPFPVKHPVLQKLQGEFEIEKALPDWWNERIAKINGNLQFLFMGIKPREYHTGLLDEKRYKIFRAMIGEDEKKKLPQSPKLGGLLETMPDIFSGPYMKAFNSRGEKTSTAIAHVTWKPEDMFYMSNGDGWRSCQHFAEEDGYRNHLRSGMFNTSRGMVYVLSEGKTHISEPDSVIARALLEVGFLANDPTQKPYIMVDRTYGNDAALQTGMVDNLRTYIESRGYGFCVTRRNTTYSTFESQQFLGYPYFIPGDWSNPYNDTLQTLSSTRTYIADKKYSVYGMYTQCYAGALEYTGKTIETEIDESEE